MEISKNLTLARQARAEGNSEDAKTYYNKAREENPNDGEAKFFYMYYALYEGTNGELPRRFDNVCQAAISALKMVKNSGLPTDAQYETLSVIVDAFCPMTWSINKYMNNKNRETKVGDRYVQIYDRDVVQSACKKGMFTVRDLGDQIRNIYGTDPGAMTIAVKAWKEYVSLAQTWYAYPPKGEAEAYAEKIKNIDPSYEMPKKAGCVSFGDNNK